MILSAYKVKAGFCVKKLKFGISTIKRFKEEMLVSK